MADGLTSKIIIAAISLIVAAVLISVAATEEQTKVVKAFSGSESTSIATLRVGKAINQSPNVTITNAPTGWKIDDCPITNFVLKNQSGDTMTVSTHYVFTATTGKLALKNVVPLNSSASNTTTVQYNYCADDYINSAWGRNVSNIAIGFLAIIALAIAVGIFYLIFKEVEGF